MAKHETDVEVMVAYHRANLWGRVGGGVYSGV